ncbi:hypothetical protein Bca4012_075788 [Brassica carinata]|uniref:BnaC07g48100D protein n=4 Tax=Brassica TaxID=3705 RepID=A0A078J0P3_BRANA|nr:PREDICTED: uncharacterized protein LOC106301400 [Brassica oleracea var. oleracea]XP_013749075.2 uncharacterized protein LOC106451666 [Brassica napus]KAG2266739.1 hypothetical protein Bca52824_073818 [Brassica carinata]VDD35342.1 unnamed protein product [Brassica oleracea]KAH0867251.1 hypothetical protein HID58_074273 [Brassica napus]CAF1951142.1 unnamed protein product [Brassica napus]CDY56584.1 BnaC07g48100D [Brassica napus]
MKTLHFLAPSSAKPTIIINLKQQSYGAITQTQFVLRRQERRSLSINCSNSGNNNSSEEKVSQPLDGVEIRFKRGSRRRMREEGSGEGQNGKKVEKTVQKTWEEMTLNEKALELYVGEKGLLFWLNKLAYASIYIVIGGWILFRFVGPALNLYQLDTPPLDPKNILKG